MDLKKIREVRKSKGISLLELEKLVKINRYRISLIERGKVNPSWVTVLVICEALGIELVGVVREGEQQWTIE